MKGSEFLDAMEWVDPALIEEADTEPIRSRFAWPVWIAGAACLALLFLGLWVWSHREPGYMGHIPPESTTLPESTELYFNEVTIRDMIIEEPLTGLENPENSVQTLTPADGAALLPGELPDWTEFSGQAAQSPDGSVEEILVELGTAPWEQPVWIRIQPEPFAVKTFRFPQQGGQTALYRDFGYGISYPMVPEAPVVTTMGSFSCTAYAGAGSDPEGITQMYVEFQMGGLFCCVITTVDASSETARQTAEDGLWELMTCFARMQQGEDVSIPEEELFFNEATDTILMVDPIPQFFCQFIEPLYPEELSALLPENLPGWADFTGEVTYDAESQPVHVLLMLEDSPWSRPVYVEIQPRSFDLESRESAIEHGYPTMIKNLSPSQYPTDGFYAVPVYPRVTDVKSLICTGYTFKGNSGATELFVEFQMGELFYCIRTTVMGTANMAPETAWTAARDGLQEMMESFAQMRREQSVPTLENFRPKQKSDYAMNQQLSLEEARSKGNLGAWMPLNAPFAQEEAGKPMTEDIRYHSHPHTNRYAHNYISGSWVADRLTLNWKVSCINYASTAVQDCLLEDLTPELVDERLGPNSAMLHGDPFTLTVWCDGVQVEIIAGYSTGDPWEEMSQWVYNQLMTLKARNQATVLWNDPAPLVIFSDEVVPYGNASPVPLTPEQLEQCVPANPSHWMVFSGSTLYLSGEQVHSVCLQLPDSTGRNGFTIFIQEAPESLTWDAKTLKTQLRLTRFPANGIYEPYETNSPLLTQVEDLVFGVYRHRSQNFTRLWAVFYRNGLQYGLFIEVPTEDEAQAGADLLDLVLCYARTETAPDLSTFPRGQEGTVEPVGGGAG